PHRLPVHAARLHHDVRDLVTVQPVLELAQLGCGRRERTDLLQGFAVGLRESHAGDHDVLVHVEAGASRVQQLHFCLLVGMRAGVELASSKSRLRRSGPTFGPSRTVWGARGIPGSTDYRARSHQAKANLCASADERYTRFIRRVLRSPATTLAFTVRPRHEPAHQCRFFHPSTTTTRASSAPTEMGN